MAVSNVKKVADKDNKLFKEGRVLIEMVSSKDNKVDKKVDGKKSYVSKEMANLLSEAKRAKIVKQD